MVSSRSASECLNEECNVRRRTQLRIWWRNSTSLETALATKNSPSFWRRVTFNSVKTASFLLLKAMFSSAVSPSNKGHIVLTWIHSHSSSKRTRANLLTTLQGFPPRGHRDDALHSIRCQHCWVMITLSVAASNFDVSVGENVLPLKGWPETGSHRSKTVTFLTCIFEMSVYLSCSSNLLSLKRKFDIFFFSFDFCSSLKTFHLRSDFTRPTKFYCDACHWWPVLQLCLNKVLRFRSDVLQKKVLKVHIFRHPVLMWSGSFTEVYLGSPICC